MKMEQSFVEIVDNYEHLDPYLEYVLENVLSEHNDESEEYRTLSNEYNSILLDNCECISVNSKCGDYKCAHGGNYKWDEISRELVLNTTLGLDKIIECSSLCKCDRTLCKNKLVQFGPRKHLLVKDSKKYGSKGLITTANIPCGGFICEYAGELITQDEAFRRTTENESNFRMNYILCLHEISRHRNAILATTIVDPSRRGNIGRYLNHSCEPNCGLYSVRVDCPVPKIGIFTNRQILAGEELCFHYGGEMKNPDLIITENDLNPNRTLCLCGSKKCIKILPHKSFLWDKNVDDTCDLKHHEIEKKL